MGRASIRTIRRRTIRAEKKPRMNYILPMLYETEKVYADRL